MQPKTKSQLAWDIVRGACPNCRQAKIFKRLFNMHPTCPVCGIVYERETGYFLMSIFVGYGLYYLFGIPLVWWLLRQGIPMLWFWIISISLVVITLPLVFHYARIIWIHADNLLDPREPSAEWLAEHGEQISE